MWAIIGGSGFEKFDGFEVIEELDGETPFGPASSGLKRVRVGSAEALFLSRHGAHHEKLPAEVNYRANIFALKKNGARAILSFSAIGSLQKELAPGDMVIPNQYLDRTKGVRDHSFCGDGIIGHVSLAKPVDPALIDGVRKFTPNRSWKTHFDKTYVCVEGPYFSTKAESNFYRQLGCDVIGMTNYPEYALAREAGLPYLPCCFVTDYDCWDDSIPHVTVAEVIEVMRNNNAKAFELAAAVLDSGDALYKDSDVPNQGLRTGLFMPKEAIPAEKKPWLEVLLS